MTNKDFFDDDFRKKMILDYEDIRQRRNKLQGRPDALQVAMINLEKQFESFYRRFI